jgi:hypothetical protein
VLNLPSYASGSNPWGIPKKNKQFSRCVIDDGLFEVVGLINSMHAVSFSFSLYGTLSHSFIQGAIQLKISE